MATGRPWWPTGATCNLSGRARSLLSQTLGAALKRPLKNATLRQLATFHALARLGSVTRAAEEMNLTQPAVSLQLGALEDSAGVPLLARGARGVKLTEAGVLLADYATRILAMCREAGEAMAAHQGILAGTLRLGAVTTAEHLLPGLLLEFVQLHPQVKVSLSMGNRAEVVGQLAAQEVDLVVMGRPPAELDTAASTFARHPMAFVASPHHPLVKAAGVTLEDIRAAKLLVRERGSGTRTTVEQIFKAADLEFAFGIEMASNEALKQMCGAGFGIAFLSLHACELELKTGLLALIEMPGYPVQRSWQVIRLASRPVPAAASSFERFLIEKGQEHIDQRFIAGTRKAPGAENSQTARSPTPAPARR